MLDIRPAPVYKTVPLNVYFIESTSPTSKIETPKVIKKKEKKRRKNQFASWYCVKFLMYIVLMSFKVQVQKFV